MTAEQRFFPIWKMCLCAAGVLSLMGCAAKHGDKAVNSPDVQAVETTSSAGAASVADSDSAFEDYDDEESEAIADPLEGWNRFWFGFNDVLLLKVVKPVYTGYTYITPSPVRTGLSNAFHNIQMPIRFLNCVLQGRFGEAWIEVGRFVVNTTAGFGGVFDVAKQSKPLIPVDNRDADFGQTLGVWGFGEGIYLVWPVVGPSTVRDTVGLAGDWTTSAFFWISEPIGPLEFEPALAASLGLRFNDMGTVISTYESLKKSAVEPYIAARDAYVKYRRAGIMGNRFQW